MVKITLGVDGMMCGHCEAHVNDCVRNGFDVKSVKSDHKKNETVIIADNELSEEKLTEEIGKTGYKVTSYKSEPYEKKGLFSFGS
ncbi:MAG: heavy-metal-associated domain-containing protein [Ruminococcus sp.]|nr:heavy-metal-associated domain-containing protein [Ruminococcus sp.]